MTSNWLRSPRSSNLDPVLTAHVLRHANSALYGPATVIHTVKDALSYIGLRKANALIMECAMKQAAECVGNRRYAHAEWASSLFTANVARALGTLSRTNPEMCYTAGLLHDIGRLPLLQYLNAHDALPREPKLEGDHEIILETLHRSVGSQLADAWELPPAVKEAIQVHLNGREEDEECAASYRSTHVVEAAGDLCFALGLGRHHLPFAVMETPSLRELGINHGDLQVFVRVELPKIAEQVTDLL